MILAKVLVISKNKIPVIFKFWKIHNLFMIEAKSVKVIRNAEIRVQKLIDECRKDSEERHEDAIRSAKNRIETEILWAQKRSEKMADHAKKTALEERKDRYSECEKTILNLKKTSASKKRKAIQSILRDVLGGINV